MNLLITLNNKFTLLVIKINWCNTHTLFSEVEKEGSGIYHPWKPNT